MEFTIVGHPLSSFSHVGASESFLMVHWYSSTRSPPSMTLRPRRQ
jgi:hypothetical protein